MNSTTPSAHSSFFRLHPSSFDRLPGRLDHRRGAGVARVGGAGALHHEHDQADDQQDQSEPLPEVELHRFESPSTFVASSYAASAAGPASGCAACGNEPGAASSRAAGVAAAASARATRPAVTAASSGAVALTRIMPDDAGFAYSQRY